MKIDIRESDFNITERNYTRKVSVYCDDEGFMILLKLEQSLLARNYLDKSTHDLFQLLDKR